MTNDIDTDQTDAWLVAAGRELDSVGAGLSADANRLIGAITASLGRVRRPGRALATDTPGVWISDRVLKQLLAIRIRRSLGRLAVRLLVDGNDDEVERIRIGVIARYNDILPADSEEVRDVITDVLVSLLGPHHATTASRQLDVRWQDLETRDWPA